MIERAAHTGVVQFDDAAEASLLHVLPHLGIELAELAGKPGVPLDPAGEGGEQILDWWHVFRVELYLVGTHLDVDDPVHQVDPVSQFLFQVLLGTQ